MYRCALTALAATTLCISAQAQVQRAFPADALRGELVVLQTPAALLNGKAITLAPGARLRGDTNLLLQPASVSGQKLIVHYTIEPLTGMLMNAWVLNPVELANKPWPRTAQEAATWHFDAAAQVWTKS